MAAATIETVELSGSPSILPLYLRSAAPLIPGASMLPFVPGSGKDIPTRELALSNLTIDREALAAYNRVCGFPVRDAVPATYLHNLAFPLHMALMCQSDFPFGAMGLVHVNNTITMHRPVRSDETVSLTLRATPLVGHPKGKTFDMVAKARVGRTVVWEGVSTYLRRGSGDPSAKAAPASDATVADPAACATWKLPADLGRRFAAVSGDRNPIHLHGWTAKPLGFNTAIAHGMWTKARCLAALDGVLPDAFTISVDFRRPVSLPSTVTFGDEAAKDGSIRFAVRNARKGTPHLDGTVVAVAPKKR